MEDELWSQLTDSEKEAWQQVQNLISSSGWKLVARDLGDLLDNVNTVISNASNWDQYVQSRGQREGLLACLSVEERILHQLGQAVAERTNEEPEGESPDAFA